MELDEPLDGVKRRIYERVTQNRELRRRKRMRFLQIAVILIALLSTTWTVFFPESVYAFREKLSRTIINWEQRIQLLFSGNPLSEQPPDQLVTKINTVQPNVPYPILVPAFIPEGFQLEEVQTTTEGPQIETRIKFKNGESFFYLSQKNIEGTGNFVLNVNTKTGKLEKTNIRNYQADLITYTNGGSRLIWTSDDNVEYQIYGNISPDDAIKLANQLHTL